MPDGLRETGALHGRVEGAVGGGSVSRSRRANRAAGYGLTDARDAGTACSGACPRAPPPAGPAREDTRRHTPPDFTEGLRGNAWGTGPEGLRAVLYEGGVCMAPWSG